MGIDDERLHCFLTCVKGKIIFKIAGIVYAGIVFAGILRLSHI